LINIAFVVNLHYTIIILFQGNLEGRRYYLYDILWVNLETNHFIIA